MACVAFAFAGMGVGEGDPYLVDFSGTEEVFDLVDAGADEGHVMEVFVAGLGESAPHAGAFDIDADKVLSAVRPCQSYCIFGMSASQFQNDGIIVMENFFVPSPPESVALGMHFLVGGLEDIGIASHIGEFGQFILAHDDVVLC